MTYKIDLTPRNEELTDEWSNRDVGGSKESRRLGFFRKSPWKITQGLKSLLHIAIFARNKNATATRGGDKIICNYQST